MKNNAVFVTSSEIGDLFIYDTLVSYVCPISFVCVDEFDTKYLFYEISDENNYIEWLVAKINKGVYYSMIDKKISIQEAFKKSSFLRKIKKIYDEDIAISIPVSRSELAQLPKEDVLAEKDCVVDKFGEQTLEFARETGMTTFDIRLYAGSDRHSIPYTIMQEICKGFTSLISSLFSYKRKERINVCTAYGSCVIRFSFPDQINLFNESNAIQETSVFSDILAEPSINANIRRVSNKKKFVSSFASFFQTIKKTGSDVEFITASPNSSSIKDVRLQSYVVAQRYEDAKNIFNETKETIRVRGTLTAFDTIKNRFKFRTDSDDSFEGAVEKKNFNETYNVPFDYLAIIEVTKKVDEGNFTERKSYLLKHLTPIERCR